MAHDYIPRRDIDFKTWSAAFRDFLVADPVPLGVSPAAAAEYSVLHDAYASAYDAAAAPGTRTSVSIVARKGARRAAEREARRLARIIQATAGVTDAQRSALGLTVREGDGARLPRPAQPPRVVLQLLSGSTLQVRLSDPDSPRRGKPAGVAGAMVFSHVGDRPPHAISKWRLEGPFTRPISKLTIGPNVQPGAKVWVTAYWYNPRGQRGPAATPAFTHLQCQTLRLENQGLARAA